jgi:hypothetical protein
LNRGSSKNRTNNGVPVKLPPAGPRNNPVEVENPAKAPLRVVYVAPPNPVPDVVTISIALKVLVAEL